MQPSGSFLLQIGETGRGLGIGYTVRLGWIGGAPYITDLGSAGAVLVNAIPIEPNTPHRVWVGDTITIGDTSLSWGLGTQPLARVPEPAVAPPVEEPAPLPAPSPPAPVYRLVVTTPEWTNEFPLTAERIRIGRASANDICIDEDHVSRQHAELILRADGYEIVDLGSVNGLTFQGARIASKVLADGDVLWIAGRISLGFRVAQPAAEPALMAPPPAWPMDETQAIPRPPAPPDEVPGVDETVLVPRRRPEPPPVRAPEELVPPAVEPTDETLIVPKRPARPEAAPDVEETVLVPRRRPEPPPVRAPEELVPPAVEPTDETLIVPRRPARPEAAPDVDETLLVPRRHAEPPAEPAPEESVPPTAEPPDETLIVPKPVARPPMAEAQDPTLIVPRQAPRPPAAERPIVEPARRTEWMDMAQVLDTDVDLSFASSTLVRNTQIPHLVVYLGDQTWEVQLTQERMTIGRTEDNDIPIPDRFVSSQHASIERRGDRFVIRETQSRNGIWLGRERIEEHTLRDGDVLSLGGAKLVFKGGFSSDELTLIGVPRIDGKPARRPVVFVPGMMGSELWLGSEQLWPNPKYILSNTEIFRLPGDPRIEARNIVSEVVIVPNIVKQRQYSGLGDYLEAGLGYTRGKDLLEFAYDWRQDVRLSAQRLAEAIERWQVDPPVTIIAHSLGTLVTRYYVEQLGGKRVVERIILMGGPHYGTPKGLAVILTGPGMLPFGVGAERMRNVLATFPSAYQILPIYPCITDQDGTYIDALKDRSWLPEHQRPYLGAARSFRRELGEESSVPTVSIFGYGFKTALRVQIHRRPDGQWQQVDFIEDTAGDLSVPSGSAVLKGSEIHPVFQEHGSLYVDDDVRMRLKVELTRSTTWQRRKY
jgi:pSer/pThr/pTyr-binding forkhead associated (FHA) protein